ncbi:MAG: hypothetical protein GC168_15300 [Candidatus Hydrogenedens sp.]|nr:hypothetical protein [Candidatus Hydrogenedens sp.]
MLKDRMVRVKLQKRFAEQRPISYIGKCTAFSDNWLVVDGKELMLARHVSDGVQISKTAAPVVIPRENVESIRVLPDNFSLDSIRITTEGQQIQVVVDGSRDCFIGEMGEG